MYDSMCKGTVEEKAQAVRRAIAYDSELHSIPYYAEDKKIRALLLSKDVSTETDHWTGKLFPEGISESDIEFLFQILNPDPTQRWTTEDIARGGYLDFN
jgi:hypothetical protein